VACLRFACDRRCGARSVRFSIAMLGCLCLCIPSRGGTVSLVSQDRSVSARFNTGMLDQFHQAPDFGPFVAQAGSLRGNALADQNSTLTVTPDGAAFHVLANVRGSSPPGAMSPGAETFDSFFQVAFNVTSPTDYNLLYAFGPAGANDIASSATFTGPFGTRQLQSSLNESGVLQPGSYQFQIDAMGGQNVTYVLNFSAVPLPSALWMGLIMFPPLILIARWSRSKMPRSIRVKYL
jgi:hypothetical protein